MSKNVYSFGGGTADGDGKMKDILGGKGSGLAGDVPRWPPRTRRFHNRHGRLQRLFRQRQTDPEAVQAEITKALTKLEKEMGKKLGNAADPLLLSVRSGAKFSMPGMMNTF